MTGRIVRVASGQGFWGDWQEAPKLQVRSGDIDYLMLDYLAEITMSILQKQRVKNPAAGYARDFVPLMLDLAAELVDGLAHNAQTAVEDQTARLRLDLAGEDRTNRPLIIRVVVAGDLSQVHPGLHQHRSGEEVR